ncbi:hypothetical protein HPP92_028685 [Vanilla planifolia]|uniref:Uncharacterized protein n=1 Tax=Vanilla planifolia TaxID=51239 RepID=A0A835P4G8_VANPL|nr:hypothetical protein HPP92_028685 [Vanilla planifolia]KAG0446785.1 hypothetical protein HPP92_028669 [Vanilla planifolia]
MPHWNRVFVILQRLEVREKTVADRSASPGPQATVETTLRWLLALSLPFLGLSPRKIKMRTEEKDHFFLINLPVSPHCPVYSFLRGAVTPRLQAEMDQHLRPGVKRGAPGPEEKLHLHLQAPVGL